MECKVAVAGRLSSLNTDESLAVQGYLEYRNQFLRNMQLAAVAYVNEEKNRTKSRSEVPNHIKRLIITITDSKFYSIFYQMLVLSIPRP